MIGIAGVLLIVDAGITLAWQEPLSYLRARASQSALERSLDAKLLDAADRSQSSGSVSQRRRAAVRYRRGLAEGEVVARLELPTLHRRFAVVQGTDAMSLRKGPGHYPDTPLPGEGGTVAIAGHRTTYLAPFRRVDRLAKSQPIVLTLPYGRFVYRVEETRIVRPSDVWVKRLVGYERLILTACHPLYSAAKRIVVFARLVPSKSS